MLIRVMYSDGRFDLVKQRTLDDLLTTDQVASFRRSSGWVVIGRDLIRDSASQAYAGPERRRYAA